MLPGQLIATSSPLSLTPATLASSLFLKHSPVPGLLHLVFPLPDLLFSQIPTLARSFTSFKCMLRCPSGRGLTS